MENIVTLCSEQLKIVALHSDRMCAETADSLPLLCNLKHLSVLCFIFTSAFIYLFFNGKATDNRVRGGVSAGIQIKPLLLVY